ncbi:hypothetical protein RLOC_00002926 [Lonchura striata]|uniref:Uncharacterized protein n=1 Tax=Lonchura striata TaxID=40157 RepID=A0A218U6P1_9PASE|nr:hypothetical protein RLOC_00002926 [Lonchura striata domestica]
MVVPAGLWGVLSPHARGDPGLCPAGIPAAPGQSQRLLQTLQGEAAAGPRGGHAVHRAASTGTATC